MTHRFHWLLLSLLLFPTATRAAVLTVGHVGAAFTTLAAAVAAAGDNDTIQIFAGTYTGLDGVAEIDQSGLTIEGVGGTVTLDANGAIIPNGKAIITISGPGVTIRDIGFANASVPHMNGAGIRLQAPGVMTCENCTFIGNQDGILT